MRTKLLAILLGITVWINMDAFFGFIYENNSNENCLVLAEGEVCTLITEVRTVITNCDRLKKIFYESSSERDLNDVVKAVILKREAFNNLIKDKKEGQ